MDNRLRQMAFFLFVKVGKGWLSLKDFEIKQINLQQFVSLLYKTNRFHVTVHLSSNRSQRTSKCGKNISDTLGYNLVPKVLSLSRKYPGCGWSRVYVCKSNPRKGWILDLILSTLSMEVKGALLFIVYVSEILPDRCLMSFLFLKTFMSLRY